MAKIAIKVFFMIQLLIYYSSLSSLRHTVWLVHTRLKVKNLVVFVLLVVFTTLWFLNHTAQMVCSSFWKKNLFRLL